MTTMMSVVVSMVVSSLYFMACPRRGLALAPLVRNTLPLLLPQDLLDLTDLFLHFAGYLFGSALSLQIGIIGYFSGCFLDLALCFVKGSFRLVPNARFHGIPPLKF